MVRDLADFSEQVFAPCQMKETTFGPVSQAVPTLRGVPAGVVHDPARVLGSMPEVQVCFRPLEIWKFSWSITYRILLQRFYRRTML